MSTTATTKTTTCVVENNKETTSAPAIFSGALAQVPQQVESEKKEKKTVRLSSLLKYSEKKMAEKKLAAIAVQECEGGPIRYLHPSSMVPQTTVIVRDRETGALIGLPAVMGG